VLGQLVDGQVQVDVVGAAAVPDAGELTGAAPGGDVAPRPGNSQPGGNLAGAPQRLRVGLAVGRRGREKRARLSRERRTAAAWPARPVAARQTC